MSMPSIRIRVLSLSASGSCSSHASVTVARTIHQDTANPAAVSAAGRPERMTASTTWFRSPIVGRARRGAWGVDSNKDSRVSGLFALPADLDHSTSRVQRREFAEPLMAALFPPGCDDPVSRASRRVVGADNDLPASGSDGSGDDVVVWQVEEDGAASAATPVGSDQRLVVQFQVE